MVSSAVREAHIRLAGILDETIQYIQDRDKALKERVHQNALLITQLEQISLVRTG
jgi:hypothetical protein